MQSLLNIYFKYRYVVLCESILINKAYSDIEAFSKDFLPKLFAFRNEKVPNIRVLLARVIKNQLLNLGIYDNFCFTF